tara:strand:+ start:137 stop:460 length:324 start_codon:yes stop_codon:yes gene_type:complete
MEKIEQLPKDKIPLSNEEKDIFQWLYPMKKQLVENCDEKKESSHSFTFYSYLFVFSIILFIVLYPNCNIIWKKIIPTDEKNPIYSIIKVFIVLFLLFLFHISYQKFS